MIMLTFDDNYRSWFTSLPLFERLGAKVTFYVNTLPFRGRASDAELAWFFERISAAPEPTLSVDELKCIADRGHTIGAHTHTHLNLGSIGLEQAKDEIRTSKLVLEDILLKPVTTFAYPFGMRRHFPKPLRDYCFEIGFKTVATGLPALQHAKAPSGIVHRSALQPDLTFERNLDNFRVDGRIFERITGRNAVAR
jgi:peptidoglycan/xylan/chitin deacetylase (PgdA/CDA1 family)